MNSLMNAVLLVWSVCVCLIVIAAYHKSQMYKLDAKSWREGYTSAWRSAVEYGTITTLIALMKQDKITKEEAAEYYYNALRDELGAKDKPKAAEEKKDD